ncbi:hypothetical protein C9E81_12495 [Paracoccus alkanivorans]|uniref:Uncharacterized protein n=1 Tax=Paracoccus alkanivorans TaxID=2116655 RepID=A0A3M0MEZ3_9RHOB|nr:hypothetical protein C9E81_12495 [Paracoccus alkanivorans]
MIGIQMGDCLMAHIQSSLQLTGFSRELHPAMGRRRCPVAGWFSNQWCDRPATPGDICIKKWADPDPNKRKLR